MGSMAVCVWMYAWCVCICVYAFVFVLVLVLVVHIGTILQTSSTGYAHHPFRLLITLVHPLMCH